MWQLSKFDHRPTLSTWKTRQSTPSRRVPETQTQLSAIGLTHCVPENNEMIEDCDHVHPARIEFLIQESYPATSSKLLQVDK